MKLRSISSPRRLAAVAIRRDVIRLLRESAPSATSTATVHNTHALREEEKVQGGPTGCYTGNESVMYAVT